MVPLLWDPLGNSYKVVQIYLNMGIVPLAVLVEICSATVILCRQGDGKINGQQQYS